MGTKPVYRRTLQSANSQILEFAFVIDQILRQHGPLEITLRPDELSEPKQISSRFPGLKIKVTT